MSRRPSDRTTTTITVFLDIKSDVKVYCIKERISIASFVTEACLEKIYRDNLLKSINK